MIQKKKKEKGTSFRKNKKDTSVTKGAKKIEIILSFLNIKAPTFAKNIGVRYSRIQDIQDKKTKNISGDLATKINAEYPQFSIEWLLSDTGETPAFINNTNNGNQAIVNNGSQIISSQSHEIELLKQQLADKMRIIELLEIQVKLLTKTNTLSINSKPQTKNKEYTEEDYQRMLKEALAIVSGN